MLKDLIQSAYDRMAELHQAIYDANKIDADTWLKYIQSIQQKVWPIGTGGAANDAALKALQASLAGEHAQVDELSSGTMLDVLQRLELIEAWQKILGQISTSSLSVMLPFQIKTNITSPAVLQPVRTVAPSAAEKEASTSLALKPGQAEAMGIGAGLGAALIGTAAFVATGSGRAAALGAGVGLALGAGAGYVAKNG